MKKIQSIVAGLLVVALLTCSASAMSFPDVPKDSDYATAIENISELKIMVGDAQGNFNPDKIVSRVEMATIICRMLGATESLPKTGVFTDVPTAHWGNTYIGKAAALGIVGGYGNGQFGPADPVTYEQAVTMVVRAMGDSNEAISYGGYPDGFIQVAEERSLLEGLSATQGQGMTRGAVAMLLNNYYTRMPAKPGDGHTHHYVEKAVLGSGDDGHYERVQSGKKLVQDWAEVSVFTCNKCGLTTKDPYEINGHNISLSSGCRDAGFQTETINAVIGTHEEPDYEDKWVGTSAAIFHLCALCGQMEPKEAQAHTHTYVEMAVPAIEGHYEEVQIGTKTVNDYAKVTIYGCGACSFTSYNYADVYKHTSPSYEESKAENGGHAGCSTWDRTTTEIVGTHEEPRYARRWIASIATTARVCSICGQQEP